MKENTVEAKTTKINTTNYYFDNMNNLHVNDKKYLIFNIYDACTINSTVQFNYKDETIEVNLPSDEAALKLFKEISKKVK